jgi:hypothetical protein
MGKIEFALNFTKFLTGLNSIEMDRGPLFTHAASISNSIGGVYIT